MRIFAYRSLPVNLLADPRTRRRAPIVIVAILSLIAAVLISDRFARQRAIVAEHDRLANVARLTASSFQRQVDKFRLVATTLSADPDVERLLDIRTPAVAARLNDRLSNLSTALDASVIYLLDAQGLTIASSNWRQPDSFLGENYGFRAYFIKATQGGAWEQYALGTRSQIPGLFVARRVVTAGNAKGVIVVKIRFDRLEREWADAAGSAFVTSQQGVILVSSIPAWRFQTIRALDASEKNQLRAQVEFGDAPLKQLDLFASGAVVQRPDRPVSRATSIMAREALPSGWSVNILGPLDKAVGAAQTLARLAILVTVGSILALFVLYALRRRAIIAGEQRDGAARIADLKDRLVQANKLSSLGQMAAGIGHEINQPLTSIGIRARNARTLIDTGRSAEAAEVIGEIGALTTRMGAITSELRRFARRGDGRIGKVSLQAVLQGTQLLLGDRIRTSGTKTFVDVGTVHVVGNQGKLEQVFVNLIQNALDAMEVLGGEGAEIHIGVATAGDATTITMRDTGPGVPPEIRDRLFQPFSTSKEDGLGLGLVICRDIIADFGGELRLVPSTHGAVFSMTLKVAH